MGMTEPPQSALLRSATLIKASVAVPHPLKKNTGQLIQLNRHLPEREKKTAYAAIRRAWHAS